MTGGSAGNQHTGLENNGQGSGVKDFLFSTSRRRSTSAVQMSMLGSGGTKSDEQIPLTSHCETAFVKHVTPRSCFLSNNMDHSGRLRTSSLTMDVSVCNRKEIDSGNSSLIDSSSADSYQDFGSGCRSPTTSSSKSEQSLTSVNHNEFQIDNNRQRHSSVSDSIGGSSGKMSINTSDITESSEDSLTQDKNKDDVTHSLSFCVQEDAYSDSECQPFLYLPGNHSLETSSDDITNGNSYHTDLCELERYGDDNLNYSSGDIFNSTAINVDLNEISHESLRRKEHRRMKDKEINTHLKYTAGERNPLLQNHEGTSEGITRGVVSFNNRLNLALGRSTSLGNFSESLIDNLDTLRDSAVTPSPLPAGNSHTEAAAAYQIVTSRLQVDYTSESQSLTLCDHHLGLCPPNRREDRSHVSESPSTHVLVNVTHSHSCQQQRQHHQTGSHSHLCSNYDHACMGHCMFNNEYVSPHVPEITSRTSTTGISQSAPHYNKQGSSFPDTSQAATRSPVQNLESVLGYGTPVSISVLKHGSKPLKSENHKPLQVLVPTIKSSVQEANQIDFTDNLTSSTLVCHVNNNLNHVCLEVDKVLQMESTGEMKAWVSDAQETMKSSTSDNETSPCENQIYNVSDVRSESHIQPAVGMHENQSFLFCERIPKEHFRYYFNNQKIIPSTCVPLSSGEQNELRIEDNLHRTFPRNSYNMDSLPSNANQQRLIDLNHKHNTDNARQPILLGGTCLSEPIFNRTSHAVRGVQQGNSNKNIESKTNSLSTSHYQPPSFKNSKLQGRNVHHPTDYHVINTYSPTAKHATELKTNLFVNENDLSGNHCTQNEQDHRCLHYHGHDKLHNANLPKDECDLSQTQVDDNGYQAGMMLTVPKACFMAGFLDCDEQLNPSRTNSIVNPAPCIINSVHQVNRNISLPCSNTNQLGLLKASLDSKRQNNSFIREIPDYKYLCFVAIVLNPVLGLVALVCNYCAQKDLKQHKRRRANNFYFATIAFSTVAIFFTLIGGALLIAHSIILKGEKHEFQHPPATHSCKDQFFGHDDSLQSFFGIEFALYCEITKNEKIMQALKRYWLEDAHNKAIHNKQRANSALAKEDVGRNATTFGNSEMQIEDPDIFTAAGLNDTSSLLAKKAYEDHPPSDYDEMKSNLPTLSSNGTSNNSLTQSNENPIIPPGMQREYERYLGGEKRTKVNDGQTSVLRDVLPQGDHTSSPSNDT